MTRRYLDRVCVCVCVCDESPMCPVGYRLYRGRVIENAFNLSWALDTWQ